MDNFLIACLIRETPYYMWKVGRLSDKDFETLPEGWKQANDEAENLRITLEKSGDFFCEDGETQFSIYKKLRKKRTIDEMFIFVRTLSAELSRDEIISACETEVKRWQEKI